MTQPESNEDDKTADGDTPSESGNCEGSPDTTKKPKINEVTQKDARGNKLTSDRTITMILQNAGKEPLELASSSLDNTGQTRSIKKTLIGDEGIAADEEKYDVKEMLAKGGMGMVMAAKDVNIRRQVAVKVMLKQGEESQESLLRFVEEAQVTGQLEHPNIVPVHELGVQPSGQVFYTMKMIRGRTLKDVIKKLKEGDEATVKEFHLTRLMTIFMKVCDAVAFAHDRMVIHRDLKPENVMIGDFGEVLVVDWGLAKILTIKTDDSISVKKVDLDKVVVESVRSAGRDDTSEGGGSDDPQVTMDGKIMGTPRYMAPEQAIGIAEKIDCRADVYSLGAILYNILTLHNHIQSKNIYEILRNTLNGIHTPLADHETGDLPHWSGKLLPAGLKAICKKCLKVKPHERYQSVEDLQKDVAAWQEGYATEAENANLLRQLALLVARNKAVFSVAAVALAVVAILGTLSVNQIIKERDAARYAEKKERQAKEQEKAAKQKEQAAKEKERTARIEAEHAKRQERDARLAAERAKEMEQDARRIAEREFYCSAIRLATTMMEEKRFNQAVEVLWNVPEENRSLEWGYLLDQCNQQLLTLNGGAILQMITFSDDGKRMLTNAGSWDFHTGERLDARSYRGYFQTASADARQILSFNSAGGKNKGTVFNTATRKSVFSIHPRRGQHLLSGSFSEDGTYIVAATNAGAITGGPASHVGNEPKPLFGTDLMVPGSLFAKGFFSKQGTLVYPQWAIERGDVQFWSVSSGKPIPMPKASSKRTAMLKALLPSCERVVTKEGTVWDLKSASILCRLKNGNRVIDLAMVSPDGQRILTSSKSTARLWNAETGDELAVFEGPGNTITALAFSPDGTRIITGDENGLIKIWNARSDNPKIVITNTAKDGESVLSTDGRHSVVKRIDYLTQIVDVNTGRVVHDLRGYSQNEPYTEFSPDGTKIAIACNDKTIRVCDVKSGKTIAVLKGHSALVAVLRFSPDGTRIVSGGNDTTVRIWNASNGRMLHVLKGHTECISEIIVSSDGARILSRCLDSTARLWNAQTGDHLAMYKKLERVIYPDAFAPDATQIILPWHDNSARILDSRTGKLKHVLKGHKGPITSAGFFPDGKRVITTSDDKTARVWDARNGTLHYSLQGHKDHVREAIISPDGSRVLTVGRDKTVRIWETRNGLQRHLLEGHAGYVTQATFSTDGRYVATSCRDKTARIWDVKTGKVLHVLRHDLDAVYCPTFSPDGTTLATAQVGSARLWNVGNGKLLYVFKSSSRSGVPHFSPDGTRLVIPDELQAVHVVDTPTGTRISTLQDNSGQLRLAEISPDGTQIVTGSYDSYARIWDLKTGRLLHRLEGKPDAMQCCAYSKDGTLIVTGDLDGSAWVWSSQTGKRLSTFKGHSKMIDMAMFSPDGKSVATFCNLSDIRIWDAHTGNQLHAFKGGKSSVFEEIQFSPDGNHLATLCDNRMIVRWDLRTGRKSIALAEPSSKVATFRFSPDGTLIATAHWDHTATIWNAATGGLIHLLKGHSGPIVNIVFSADGKRLVTHAEDGSTRIWLVSSGQEILSIQGYDHCTEGMPSLDEGGTLLLARPGKLTYLRTLDWPKQTKRDLKTRELKDYRQFSRRFER